MWQEKPLSIWTKGKPPLQSQVKTSVAWWSNKTGNDDDMFRASTDNGVTFGEKINLSNTTNAESVVAMIDAEGDNVAVTW